MRAWKDEEYRNSLTPEQLATIPPNPAGELSEEELNGIDGGTYKFIVPQVVGCQTPKFRSYLLSQHIQSIMPYSIRLSSSL